MKSDDEFKNAATQEKVSWRFVVIYCCLAFALFWIPFLLMTWQSNSGNPSGIWTTIFGIAGPFSPLIAALIMRLLISREGFADAHLGIRRVSWKFWLLALLLPFFWNSVQDAIQYFAGFIAVDWSKIPAGLYRVPINLFGGLIIFIGEEFGWRSYLVEKLRPLGRWNALLLSGFVWSLWHLPLLIVPNLHYGYDLTIFGTILTLFVFVLMGFIFGWLYLESNSVWPCVLMHSFNNLVSLKLFTEARTVQTEPDLLQNSLMAIGPILLVWLMLFLRGEFTNKISKDA